MTTSQKRSIHITAPMFVTLAWSALGVLAAEPANPTTQADREAVTISPGSSSDLEKYNVVWDSPSKNSAESMPLGGGEIGCNVWVENSDLLFYAQQSGSFDKNGEYNKMGRFRIRFDPNPFAEGGKFKQELKLRQGYVQIIGDTPTSGKVTVNLWVEVKRPVIHVDIEANREIGMTAAYESWRFKDVSLPPEEKPATGRRSSLFDYDGYQIELVKTADVIESGKDSILWFQNNGKESNAFEFALKIEQLESIKDQMWDPLRNLISGGLMTGANLEFAGTSDGTYFQTPFRAWHFKSKQVSKTHHLDIFGRAERAETADGWKSGLLTLSKAQLDRGKLWKDNLAWWDEFWNRAYVIINPGKDARDHGWRVARNYNLFRYQLGGNYYGRAPTKFNGGNLTFDAGYVNRDYPYCPDYRRWGGWSYTAANQRLVYWPFLKSGDFEGMLPQFDVYGNGLTNAVLRTKAHWGHEGCSFAEQFQHSGMPVASHYGFVENGYSWFVRPKDFAKGELSNPWISTFYQGQLEHAFMILEYRRFSGKDISAYLPFIMACLKFYDQHYQMIHLKNTGKPLDEQGKLVIFPSTPGEHRLNSTNPADAVAGLMAIAKALLELPEPALSTEQRNYVAEFQKRIPDLPTSKRTVDGKERTFLKLSSYDEAQGSGFYPNLHSVFPYNLFYLGSPNFDWAFDTWKYNISQTNKQAYVGHRPSVIYSARMGLAEEAKSTVSRKLDDRSGNSCRFPSFWGPGFDWTPDHNWPGGGMIGLQEMLMQTQGNTIRLLPAWPRDWDVDFKLHAPYHTIVGGRFVNGELKELQVTPRERMKDVVYPPKN